MEKASLACRACKKQAAEQIRLIDYSLPSSLLVLCDRWPQIEQLKATHIDYFIASAGQEFRYSLAGSAESEKPAVKVSARLCCHLGAWLGKNVLPSSFRLLAEFISRGCVTEGSDVQLTVSCGSLLCGLPQHGPVLHQASKKGACRL